MLEWFTAIGLLVGVLATFRWLYKAVSMETIGWWDAASFVCTGPLIGRVVRMATARFEAIPDWTPYVAAPLLTASAMYAMLRVWKGFSKIEAAIVSLIWLPILLVTLVLFVATNPGLLD